MIEFNAKQRIVWLASYPRSGNTWTRAFLFAIYNVFRDPAYAAIDLKKMSQFSIGDNSISLFRKYLRGPIELMDFRLIAEARPKVMRDIVAGAKGAVLVKTHNARITHGTPFIEDALTAGAIYLVRNPLDVAVSFAEFRATSIDEVIAGMADRNYGHGNVSTSVYSMLSSWTGHVRSWVDSRTPTTLVVRYEDLIEDPETHFGAMAAHMLMRPTPEQLSRAIALTAFGKLKSIEEAEGFVERPANLKAFFRAGTTGQWRKALTPQQVDKLVAAHGKLMERFGYLP